MDKTLLREFEHDRESAFGCSLLSTSLTGESNCETCSFCQNAGSCQENHDGLLTILFDRRRNVHEHEASYKAILPQLDAADLH
jgi:hypothetical protein